MTDTLTAPDAPTVADAKKSRTADKAGAVVAAIVDRIESHPDGTWSAPWHYSASFLTPTNATTGKGYTGGNRFMLAMVAAERGYAVNAWATFNQWRDAKAQVRKGERGTIILRPRIIKEELPTGDERAKVIGFSAHYVFNAAQVDGWQAPELPAAPDGFDVDADAWMDAVGRVVTTQHTAEPRAYYSPAADYVHLPLRELFHDAAGYYSTRAHEYCHATGHPARLARTYGKRFGDDAYAMEELTAELGSAIVLATLGLSAEPRPDHAAYLAHWLKVLAADPAALFTVASKAEAAATWLADTAARHLPDVIRSRETFGAEPAPVLALV